MLLLKAAPPSQRDTCCKGLFHLLALQYLFQELRSEPPRPSA
jgi:hypothetical protein